MGAGLNTGVPGPAEKPLSGLRILVADDDALIRDVVSELLQEQGATVMLAINGAEAVVACLDTASSIDAVLIDNEMPVLDGIAATAAIRSCRSAQELPIIGVSSRSGTSDRTAGQAAGMNEYLSKPYDVQQVVATLLRHRRCA